MLSWVRLGHKIPVFDWLYFLEIAQNFRVKWFLLPLFFIALIIQESNISKVKLHIPGFFMKYPLHVIKCQFEIVVICVKLNILIITMTSKECLLAFCCICKCFYHFVVVV